MTWSPTFCVFTSRPCRPVQASSWAPLAGFLASDRCWVLWLAHHSLLSPYSEGLSTDTGPVFCVQVKVGKHTAEGTGTNKKVAKRNAAENMLEILGFKVPQAQPTKPALKSEDKVTLRGFVSLLSICKMTSLHPGDSDTSRVMLQGQAWPFWL